MLMRDFKLRLCSRHCLSWLYFRAYCISQLTLLCDITLGGDRADKGEYEKNSLVAALLAALLLPCSAFAAERLTVLLDWFINPDHGPLYVAQEEYFKAAGLLVGLKQADPNAPPKLVAAGKADLAISYQPQLHIQADRGLPLVRIATLVAAPLNSLVVLKEGPIKSVRDLKGKKVGFSVGGFEDALLSAMLARQGMTLKDIELINVNFALSPALISGKVDAVIGAFRNFELNQLDLKGRAGRAFYVEEEGVPAYDELIVVANQKDLGRPALKKFVAALEAGVQY